MDQGGIGRSENAIAQERLLIYGEAMNCPACDRELVPRNLAQVTVDVCEGGCGGVWLDNFELGRVEANLPADLLGVTRDPNLVIDENRRRSCPRCDGVKMQRHPFSAQHNVEVDSCPGCGGYWLDAGELAVIRGNVEPVEEKSGPIRVEVAKKPKLQTPPAGGVGKPAGGIAGPDRAQTLDSLYKMRGSKY